MENIGGTFRLLRKSKHLSLDAVGKGIVTTSFLSRFERGQYDISVQNLNRLLERINVTWSEFVYINMRTLVAMRKFSRKLRRIKT